jgi:hypothetical protein
LADDHHLGGVVDEVDAGDFADFAGGLHVDDALAAAGLEAVGVDVGALAVAVVGDGEDEAGGEAEFFVELLELGGGFGGELGGGELGGGSKLGSLFPYQADRVDQAIQVLVDGLSPMQH